MYTKNGHIRQCNQGRYTFDLTETACGTKLVFNMEVPRFMDTNSLNVEVQPTFVRVDVKGKITQIRFDEEIMVERSQIQRSLTTGWLSITMPRANFDQLQVDQKKKDMMRTENQQRAKLRAIEIAEEEAREERIQMLKARNRRDAAIARGEQPEEEQKTATTGAAEPYLPPSDPSFLIGKRPNQKNAPAKDAFVPDFDEDEVPDLE